MMASGNILLIKHIIGDDKKKEKKINLQSKITNSVKQSKSINLISTASFLIIQFGLPSIRCISP